MRHSWLLLVVLLSSVALADKPKYELDGDDLRVPFKVTFEPGKTTLTAKSADAIAYVKGYLDERPDVTMLRVEVHSDSSGNEEDNQKLSEERATAVARALVAKGIKCLRVLPVGFGARKPIADNATAEGRAANQRTVFANAQIKRRAIGRAVEGTGKISRSSPCE